MTSRCAIAQRSPARQHLHGMGLCCRWSSCLNCGTDLKKAALQLQGASTTLPAAAGAAAPCPIHNRLTDHSSASWYFVLSGARMRLMQPGSPMAWGQYSLPCMGCVHEPACLRYVSTLAALAHSLTQFNCHMAAAWRVQVPIYEYIDADKVLAQPK